MKILKLLFILALSFPPLSSIEASSQRDIEDASSPQRYPNIPRGDPHGFSHSVPPRTDRFIDIEELRSAQNYYSGCWYEIIQTETARKLACTCSHDPTFSDTTTKYATFTKPSPGILPSDLDHSMWTLKDQSVPTGGSWVLKDKKLWSGKEFCNGFTKCLIDRSPNVRYTWDLRKDGHENTLTWIPPDNNTAHALYPPPVYLSLHCQHGRVLRGPVDPILISRSETYEIDKETWYGSKLTNVTVSQTYITGCIPSPSSARGGKPLLVSCHPTYLIPVGPGFGWTMKPGSGFLSGQIKLLSDGGQALAGIDDLKTEPEYSIGDPRVQTEFWTIRPVGYKLYALIDKYKYGDIKTYTGEKGLGVEESTTMSFINGTSLIQKQAFKYSKTIENTATWLFTQSEEVNLVKNLDVKVEAKLDNSIAKMIGFEASGSVQKSFNGSKETKLFEEKVTNIFSSQTHQYDSTIECSPMKKTELVAIYRQIDAEIPFEAEIEFSAIADRVSQVGKRIQNEHADAAAVIAFLKHEGYRGKITRIEGKTVYAIVTGKIKVQGAHDLQFRVKETPI